MYIYLSIPIVALSTYYLYKKYNVDVLLKFINNKKITIIYNNKSVIVDYEYFGEYEHT